MSKRKKKKHTKMLLISPDEILQSIRISPAQLEYWIKEGKLEIVRDPGGLLITASSYRRMAHSREAWELSLQAVAAEAHRRQTDSHTGLAKRFTNESSQLIGEYKGHLDLLQNIHSRYKDAFDVLHNETPDTASYILLARAIALLRMTCLCLENRYWESLLLLRPIDEALNLAEYFIICSQSSDGKKALEEWFRENKSPSNATCREALDKYSRSLSPSWDNDKLAVAMKTIHHAKSKPIHSALNDIMEVYRTSLDSDRLIDDGFDYGPCSYPRKILALVHFFRSSIWTTVQTYLMCIRLGNIKIASDDINALETLNQRFLQEVDRGRGID